MNTTTTTPAVDDYVVPITMGFIVVAIVCLVFVVMYMDCRNRPVIRVEQQPVVPHGPRPDDPPPPYKEFER